ncbi:Sorting nexin MVP1 [Spathaspora sp. JA1]|nr:Sorting nexin MVP1 [Spathaspora sp. JA1]
MNSNLYSNEDDPWKSSSGWNDPLQTGSPSPAPLGAIPPSSSTYLTSSQLLSKTSTPAIVSNIPDSYQEIHSHLIDKISNVNDLDSHIFSKLIKLNYLTNYQKSRILDVAYDNQLLPVNIANNFYQILGLIGLEIDVPGSADYVSLQFRLNNLPELPRKFINLIIEEDQDDEEGHGGNFTDPLHYVGNSTGGGSSVGGDWGRRRSQVAEEDEEEVDDPLLADHTSTHSIIEQEDNALETRGDSIDSSIIDKYVEDIRAQFKPLIGSNDLVGIKEVPEKEGIIFKHINYIITFETNGTSKKVVRRYSDFVWLLEFLLEKYPFRVIPGLPPKKFTVGNSPDSQFLQRRRRGLHRFLNQLVKHPVLGQEPVVQTFLSVPTDITTWKKQAKIDYSLEFLGKKIESNFINIIWPKISQEFLSNWKLAETNINKLIEIWTKLVLLVERHEKRQQQINFDNSKFTEMLTKFKQLDTTVYPNTNEVLLSENGDIVGSLNDSLGYIGDFFNKSSQILIDECFIINTQVLEKFKNYLDYLYSLQELFERSKTLSTNTIEALEVKIKENEIKFKKLVTEDADAKGNEVTKLRQIIINDKQEIFKQLNKDWLIKQCCFQEFIMFQQTQFLIGELWIEWCKGRYRFQEKNLALYDNLNQQVVNDMPTSIN